MQVWASILLLLLEAGARLLERTDKARYDEFRRSVASDGAGVLLSQLNPGRADASGSAEPAKGDAERRAGGVDEQ